VRGEADRPLAAVIIPALNEEQAIASVLRDIPRNFVNEAIVVDNGSTGDRVLGRDAAGGSR